MAKKTGYCISKFYEWLWVCKTTKQDQNESKMTRDFEVVDAICNNVRSCNMTTMSPLQLAKIVCEREQHKSLFHIIKSQPCCKNCLWKGTT